MRRQELWYVWIYVYDIRYVYHDMSRFCESIRRALWRSWRATVARSAEGTRSRYLGCWDALCSAEASEVQWNPMFIKTYQLESVEHVFVTLCSAVAPASADRCCRYLIPSPSDWRHLVMPSSPWRGGKVAKVAFGKVPWCSMVRIQNGRFLFVRRLL